MAALEAVAAVLTERGNHTLAGRLRDAVATARATADLGGLDVAVAHAERGRGARGRPTFGWDALTPTELDVVRLATLGLTNPDIAERLFVAPSTIKTHLSSAFRKLGVTNRTELAAEAARRSG
jgi:DNA-binding NarL/FixJ family response regulator